jgi:hypothetical protein
MTFLFELKSDLKDLISYMEGAEKLEDVSLELRERAINGLIDSCGFFIEKYEDAERTETSNEKEKKLLEDSLFYVQEAINDLEEWDPDEDNDPDFGAAIDNAASGIKFGVLNKF